MRIKKEILERIYNSESINRIALDLKRSGATIQMQMRNNKKNGRLTKMDALAAISKETGVSIAEIIETTAEEVNA